MDAALMERIVDRLLADDGLDTLVVALVEAACEGSAELDARLADLGAAELPKRRSVRPGGDVEPPGAYLERLRVSGFRGVAEEVTIDLEPGPGLTLISGRNGSGKSSFAEGLETLLTGESGRWQGRRSKLWREGWRNLHADTAPRLEARFAVEGSTPITVRRSWAQGDGLDAGVVEVTPRLGEPTTLEALGWGSALRSFRPFLSYPELGALVDAPSKAFDELWALLGLEDVTVARDRLGDRRKALDRRKKDVVAEQRRLLGELDAVDDPRAATCKKAIAGRKWDLDALAALLAGDAQDEGDAALRRLSELALPTGEELATLARDLETVAADVNRVAGDTVEQHASLVSVLERAVGHVEAYPGDCPVCERPLDEGYHEELRDRLARSRELTAALRDAHGRRTELHARAGALFADVVADARGEAAAGLAPQAALALSVFLEGMPAGAGDLATHVAGAGEAARAALAELRAAAAAALEQREQVFGPIAEQLRAFLPAARAVREGEALRKLVKAAEDWLKDAEVELRDERFRPIADRVRATWAALGQGSHVALDDVGLAGNKTNRRIQLDVSVDGTAGPAVAVMSQGELNALALSLFLPRMMLPDSPFRFLVIDDPVQAMDPFKVDGLARVLADAAKTRQVVVLTHDARLLEAVRRLRIEARVLEVARRGRSKVEVRKSRGPVDDHLRDARTIARSSVGQPIARRLVPGFCRSAIEAACLGTLQRRRLGRGDDHAELEETVGRAHSVMKMMALALFDDEDRDGDVYRSIDNRWGAPAVDAFKAAKAGAHGNFAGDLESLVRETAKLAHGVEALP